MDNVCSAACRSRRSGPPLRSRAPHAAGFTLIELMVTITVAAILMAVAVPAFRSFLQNDRLLTEANLLVASLNLARSEAIKEDADVWVCASSDGLTCSGVANWTQGWIVQLATGAAPIQVVNALAAGNSLSDPNGHDRITYQSTGLAPLLTTPAQFTLCDQRGAAFARYTEVSPFSGRVASSATPGQNLQGGALTCP